MALGKRKQARQTELWIATTELPTTAAHPFYSKLNEVLDRHGFDRFVEEKCKEFYSSARGRPSLPPGNYFRMIMLGYFEGIASERGIAWRVEDSLSLRKFLGIPLTEHTPDHSTISKTRRLIDIETHEAVFTWVLRVLAKENILSGESIGIDATNLAANAAMRNIARKDTGEAYHAFLERLAKESGIATPTKEDLIRFDRNREKRTSNVEWVSKTDPDSRIARMKNGATHLAHKVEHAVDMDSGAIVGVTVQAADKGDTTTLSETVQTAFRTLLDASSSDGNPSIRSSLFRSVVADKGYHSGAVLLDLDEFGIRSYIAEPDRGKRTWKRNWEEQQPTYANRSRIHGNTGKALLKKRGELVERSFAHCYETGAMRRLFLRRCENITKRILTHIAGFNLSLIMRQIFGRGTPRGLGDLLSKLSFCILYVVLSLLRNCLDQATAGRRSFIGVGTP